MVNERKAVVGRAAELAALGECANADADALVLLRGLDGIGRTALLDEFARTVRERGIRVVALPCTAEEERWDLFRVKAVTEFFRHSFAEFGSPKVLESLAAVNRACHPAAYESTRSRIALFADLVRLFEHVRAVGPVVVLVDDVHTAARPAHALAAARRAGCTVVATCRADGVVSGPAALGGLADRVLDLGPMSGDDIGALLNRAAGGRLDLAVLPAVRTALGPLAGHPAAALALLDEVRRDGGLTDVLGRLCLRERGPDLALSASHHLVRRTTELGDVAAPLVALAAGCARFGLDELPLFAEAFGQDLARCGEVVDRLVAAGVLRCDGDGVLSAPGPALANAIVRTLGVGGRAAVHRTFVRHLLDNGSARPPVTMDSVALAGTALPRDPSLVPALEGGAARLPRTGLEQTARWCRAALWHCPPGSADHDRLLRTALHLLVRAGDYELLAEVTEEAVTAGAGHGYRYELAAAAALAAVHIGRPLPATVHGALAGHAETAAPLTFAAGWFAGTPLRVSDMAAAFSAFRAKPCAVVDLAEIETIRAADDDHDVVAMFRLALGEEYGEPAHGPLAIYSRLVRDYLGGRWQRVVSDARRLELLGSPHVAIHDVARLLAAEVLSSTGDGKGASRWLELLDEHCPFPALRAWTQMGLAYRAAGWHQAIACGWAAMERIRDEADLDNVLGLQWYLVRLGFLHRSVGDEPSLTRVHTEAGRWHTRFGGSGLRTAELILRGLVERDATAAAEAVELTRSRGSQAELMRACITTAYVCSEPAKWYQEALGIAKALGEGWMDAHIRREMSEAGVAPPRERAAREDFSEVELRIISLVKQGRTNRQIATSVRMSEKTVENYLTRLFSRTGCRTRLDLAAASLEGRLVRLTDRDTAEAGRLAGAR
ncbi:AAA family ATPase [Lentzea sp. NBC_00516]|uniref:helix-turn-helix transcriptional regulator n=1 Tax=Lentzea sp. NBC_00516 TaxID=2903582 RepID=UPI002E80EBA5|nr:AAA family ATPase [Lentzea sp. NBC_00516]WUD28552.1 AAA family ATPase [Lentzea sp. NBC_00516]